jgi:hypothetical protein
MNKHAALYASLCVFLAFYLKGANYCRLISTLPIVHSLAKSSISDSTSDWLHEYIRIR